MYTVSVVIPTYNRAELICRSIQSVLEQDYEGLIEIIIVDDGSTDDTKQRIEAIQSDKIRYIAQEKNLGCARARNLGIEQAEGDLIAFQDSDDLWLPGKLKKEVEYLGQVDADLVFHAFTRYNPQLDIKERIPEETFKQGRVSYSDLFPENKAGTPTILAKRDCLIQNRFSMEIPNLEDWELVLRLCVYNYKVYYMNEDLLFATFQDKSISRDFEKNFWSLNMINDLVSKRYKEDLNHYQNEVMNCREKLERMNEELERANKEIVFQTERAKTTIDAYNEVVNTVSWKITAPLRKIRRLVKRV